MAKPDFSLRVLVPDSVIVRELDGELVLLNLESEIYFGLDRVGTRMWEVLTSGSATIQNGYDTLLADYEVAPDQLRKDMETLLEQLIEQGLIQMSHPEAKG